MAMSNIWGSGGLFEQRLAEKQANVQASTAIAQQRADADTSYAATQSRNADTQAFNADTERQNLIKSGGSAQNNGLRDLGKGTGNTLFGNDGNAIGFSGSKVGAGGNLQAPASTALTNTGSGSIGSGTGAPPTLPGNTPGFSVSNTISPSPANPLPPPRNSPGRYVGSLLDPSQSSSGSPNFSRSFTDGVNSNLRKSGGSEGPANWSEYDDLGLRRGGQVGLRGYQSGGQVHRMPRDLPRMVDRRKAVRGPSTIQPDNTGKPQTDVEMEHARMAAEMEMDAGMQRGAAKYANPKYPDDAKQGMRGYACGGRIHPKNKVKQPGYAQGGAIRMPPEQPGPIGDVGMDTGEDTQEVVVREGEYLLNPETVEFFGQGEGYEAGVRNLNQIVMQATGEEPGPEPVGKPQGGEEMLGFGVGGPVPTPRTFYADPQYGLRPNLGTGIVPYQAQPQAEAQPRNARGPDAAQARRFANERAAWEAEQARQNSGPKVAPQQGAQAKMAEQWAKSNPNVTTEGLRDVGRQVVQKGKYVFKPAEWAVKGANKAMPYVAPALEGAAIADVATDPRMNGLDTWEQGAESAAKLAAMGIGAKTGAAFGAPLGPVGMAGGALIGGGVGYLATDYGIDKARGALPGHNGEGSSPSDRSYGTVKQMFGMDDPMNPGGGVQQDEQPVAPTRGPAQSWTSPQGERYTEGFPDPVGNYIANNGQSADVFGTNPVNAGNLRQMPGTDTQYAGNYGGQEVIVTRGKNGEPVFTGLRTPQDVAESTARSQQEQQAPQAATYADKLDSRIQAIESGTAPATQQEYQTLLRERGALEQAYIQAGARGSDAMTPGEVTQDMLKSIEPMFPATDPETGLTTDDTDANAVQQFLSDLPPEANFWGADAGQRAQMVNAWKQFVESKQGVQKGLRGTGGVYEDLRLSPGMADMPIQRGQYEAGWNDVMNPNSNYGFMDYAGDLFTPDELLTEYEIPGVDPQKAGYPRLKTRDLVNNQQPNLREIQRLNGQ